MSPEPAKPSAVVVTELTSRHADAWANLFRECASDCFCRYWHFEGNKNDWLARLAFTPQQNEEEARARLATGDPSARGLVALDGDAVVGWLKLVPRAAVPKLRRLPVYRSLDLGTDDGVLSVACLLVHPSHRQRGVARALLKGAVELATTSGATVIEGYPHRRGEALRDAELWMGPLSLFEGASFVSVGGNDAYPVLRRALTP
jgi:GNAT superfamily N-acetyltransferase